MSKLLIPEHPLQVLPALATAIGLNEAIFLQQLHYWLSERTDYKPHYRKWEGERKPWIYNPYESKTLESGRVIGWEANFPFWSVRTIKRIVVNLRDKNLIVTTDGFNKSPYDHTLWYTINYEELESLSDKLSLSEETKCHEESDNLADSSEGQSGTNMPETPPETTPETSPETGGGATLPPTCANSHDPTDLPSVETQMPHLFPKAGREYQNGVELIKRNNWNIRSANHLQAMACFLEASRLPVPFDKTARKDWLGKVSEHVKIYGLEALRELYPRIIAQMRGDGLTVSRPGSVTNNLASYWAEHKNGGKAARASPGTPGWANEEWESEPADFIK